MLVFLLFLALLITPHTGWAAIACTGESFPFNTPSNPQAQNYTVPSVTNGITFSHHTVRNGARDITTDPTIGGLAMTRIGTIATATDTVTEVFYRLNVSAGVQSVSVGWDGTPLSYVLTMVTCGDVSQSNPIASNNQATGTSTTVSVDCTSTSATQLVLDFVGADGNAAGLTTGGGQTNIDQDIADATLSAGASSEPGNGGTVTMSHTITSNDWATICAVLNQVSTGRRTIAPLVSQ